MMIQTTTQIDVSQEELIEGARHGFRSHFGIEPSLYSAAPGRINLIGEHTDYGRGLSIPAAINRWVVITARPRQDSRIQVICENFKEHWFADWGTLKAPSITWPKFVHGALQLFSSKAKGRGVDLYISGNVPIGSGVSSSAAFEMALVNLFNVLFSSGLSAVKLTQLGQQVEHDFLGVKCGLLDQYASQFGKSASAMMLDFRSMQYNYVEVSDEISWVLVDSMVKRELASSEYSKRVNQIKEGEEILNANGVDDIREAGFIDLNKIDDDILKRRMRHYLSENLRVKTFLHSIRNHKFNLAGMLMNQSHNSLSRDFEVSCNELDFLADGATGIEGCYGSRMMGGGFGGCTINMVKTTHIHSFVEAISSLYLQEFDLLPQVDHYTLVDGAQTGGLKS